MGPFALAFGFAFLDSSGPAPSQLSPVPYNIPYTVYRSEVPATAAATLDMFGRLNSCHTTHISLFAANRLDSLGCPGPIAAPRSA
eukprot:6456768-Alexandrium_andersonii.AAC.1